jgi:hypothetical protein
MQTDLQLLVLQDTPFAQVGLDTVNGVLSRPHPRDLLSGSVSGTRVGHTEESEWSIRLVLDDTMLSLHKRLTSVHRIGRSRTPTPRVPCPKWSTPWQTCMLGERKERPFRWPRKIRVSVGDLYMELEQHCQTHLDSRDLVSTSEEACVLGRPLGRGTHTVLVVLTHKDTRQVPKLSL